MSKEEKINNFNPNGLGDANNNIYGLPFTTEKAEYYIEMLEEGETPEANDEMDRTRKAINAECLRMNNIVKEKSLSLLENNKIVALLGGDHSTPLGLMQALAEKNNSFAILQID